MRQDEYSGISNPAIATGLRLRGVLAIRLERGRTAIEHHMLSVLHACLTEHSGTDGNARKSAVLASNALQHRRPVKRPPSGGQGAGIAKVFVGWGTRIRT